MSVGKETNESQRCYPMRMADCSVCKSPDAKEVFKVHLNRRKYLGTIIERTELDIPLCAACLKAHHARSTPWIAAFLCAWLASGMFFLRIVTLRGRLAAWAAAFGLALAICGSVFFWIFRIASFFFRSGVYATHEYTAARKEGWLVD